MQQSITTNYFKFTKECSFLKECCEILSKKLSTMQEKNKYLNQKVNQFESTIFSILQRTITKKEMKEIIKEGIIPITNILMGKETEMIHVGTQKGNVEQNIKKIEKPIQKIIQLEKVIQSETLETFLGVSSLIETEDKRIASGGTDGNISISSYNIAKKTWKIDIHREEAHNLCVNSLCTLNDNKLLSGSDDYSIKVWSVSNVDIKLIKELKEHTYNVRRIIALSNERFASCAADKTIRIWKDDNSYRCMSILKHDNEVFSFLQLRNKDVLVSSYGKEESDSIIGGVSFWDINNRTQHHIIKGYSVYWSTHMIELVDGNIALSSSTKPYPIVIIDSSSYQVKKEIIFKEYITKCSSLCMFNEHSFIYGCGGIFLQISSVDYSILFQSKEGNFDGYNGIISIEGGKCFAIQYNTRITIIKPCYA